MARKSHARNIRRDRHAREYAAMPSLPEGYSAVAFGGGVRFSKDTAGNLFSERLTDLGRRTLRARFDEPERWHRAQIRGLALIQPLPRRSPAAAE